jgi:hypothetical protein
MKGDDRKAAIARYKERKRVAGVCAVRCAGSGEIWLGQSLNLDTVQNRIWFTLRMGNHPNRGLQKAWRDHGTSSFTFEIVEALPEEETPYVRDALLRERLAHWRSILNAEVV